MDDFINQKAFDYANSQLDQDLPLALQVIHKKFNWADIANAFEAGAKWMARQNPEYKPMLVEYEDATISGQPCELCPFRNIPDAKTCSSLFEERFGKNCATFAVRFVHLSDISKKVEQL